ncbi:MAG TPA: filamentous hemagglutinin family protein [Rhizomicrobium sp.]|jgi:filamentous hemagglutinin family protein
MSGTGTNSHHKGSLRSGLLRGTSLVALLTAIGASPASAQSLSALRAAVTLNNTTTGQLLKNPNINQAAAEAAGMSAATARALHYQAQVAQALSLAQQAQTAARQAVLGSPGNVPDGLVIGGLQEVPNPLPEAKDPTGLSTWQGAQQPTEIKSGKNVDVTIKQTQARAILSWETFNVGQNTTVNFDQSFKGIAEKFWVALNRVVGDSTSPSEILGSIKAQGTVLIIDQNGILFGGGSQVNVNALIATNLDIGRDVDQTTGTVITPKERNDDFLAFGLLGYADQASPAELPTAYTFSALAYDQSGGCQSNVCYTAPNGEIAVDAGANIQTGTGGYVLLTGSKIVNAGQIASPKGQVSLEAGWFITLHRSNGALGSATPDIRGFSLSSLDSLSIIDPTYVENAGNGIISAPEGYISLESNDQGAAINDGVLEATTSVSRNGFIQLYGGDIQLGAGSTLAIGPDPTAETIPQDPVSLKDFKPSKIDIGSNQSRIEVQHNAMIYAPGGNVTIGVAPGPDTNGDQNNQGLSRVFIDTGAVIDVAGLTNIVIPASLNGIAIHPVTGNDLQDDSNAFKGGFLNGATVYVDPRLSGVRSDGVAWAGSPLISAESYAQQVGVSVDQLMTRGGNVSLGAASFSKGGNENLVGDVTVKAGAVIDMDGGWVTYQAGWVQTTELIDSSGNVVNIGVANPDDTFIGIYGGFTVLQPRWGVMQTFADPLLSGRQYEGQYNEGRDAGSLTLKASTIILDGTVYAHAFPGSMQLADAQIGTGKSNIYGDGRNVQAAPSQLPNGGFLFVQALGTDSNNNQLIDGGGDINIVNQSDYQPLSANLGYGQSISIDSNGNLIIPVRDPNSYLPLDRIQTISLSADALSGMGLSDLALATSGNITVEKGANVVLAPGGEFDAESGRAITIDGSISAPAGKINLQTISLYGNGDTDTIQGGSVFVQETAQLGSYDININGTLSVRGLWTNDYGGVPGQIFGNAYTSGGSITLNAAPSVLLHGEGDSNYSVNEDISGSILINRGALLDASGGGYVSPTGNVDFSSTGGNVSLIDETNYFQTSSNTTQFEQSAIPGFRVSDIFINGQNYVPDNPGVINARISIAPGTIRDAGFGGGGTFTLDTPAISFGNGTASTGTELPFDFFSQSGFANYDITSYETALLANQFDNGLGGYNAVLMTDVLTIGAGQTLDLTQSYFALALNDPARAAAQLAALRNLASGGDIYSVLQPTIPTDAWDRKAANLTLGGLIELQVAKGGTILDEAGGVLTVSQLDNEGTIRIPGGTINQTETLPTIFGSSATSLGVHSLSDAFSTNPDGTINENAANKLGITNVNCTTLPGNVCTNAQLATFFDIYLLGTLNAGEGVHLGAGSVTDLSGISIRDPRAFAPGQKNFVNGRLVAGGTLESQPTFLGTTPLFDRSIGDGIYGLNNINANDPAGERLAETVVADPGSTLDLSGATDVYDEFGVGGAYTPTRVWSDGGTLDLGGGGTLTGATILGQGGAPQALGGTLMMLDPVFYQNDPSAPTQDAISAAAISADGFATFVAEGSISSVGDATVKLSRGFFLTSLPYDGQTGPDGNNDLYVPKIGSGGNLVIDAPYIGLDSIVQSVSNPNVGMAADNSVTFRANNIDIIGAVLFDNSVANATLDASGAVRLIGVQPADITLGINGANTSNTLQGQLSANGNLTIDAAQVYPATGSTFYITSTAADGTIRFGRTTKSAPPTPYSAGADLTIQAANVVLGGVIQVPVGTLNIGGDTPLTINGGSNIFAPITQTVEALKGSITSVSAGGLAIPYGTTTDQTEWFFAPTSSAQLSAPPAAILNFGGNSVKLDSGATVDLSGGGDLFAYEFVPGTGGSRDVLDRFNSDEFSGNGGYQYPGGTQVYAIVPGLSANGVAPYDPIYSANYADLYAPANAGQSVYLSAAPGLAAGWYTLLPAQYAMLPGGMRIVEENSGVQIAPGTGERLNDGTLVVSGYFGVAGTNTRSATPNAFEVQPQSSFLQYSDIALTSADAYFPQLAAKAGNVTPRLPIDAARLILAPLQSLVVNTTFLTTPGAGGRGSEADISGSSFDIVSNIDDASVPGAIVLTADSLTNLNASSLLIGGVRTDNPDGTTSLDVTAQSITIANDSSHPLTAPEVLLAVDGSGAEITLDNGATIIAKGTAGSPLTGNYIIDGSQGNMTGQGALLRVAVGPQRLVTRENIKAGTNPGVLTVGNVDLSGNSVLLDSSGNLTVSPNATIDAKALALDAGQVTFTSNGNGLSGLVITPQLQALFSKAQELTIASPDAIAFASGTYDFGNIHFDAPGLSLLDGNGVTIDAATLSLSNSSPTLGQCGQSGVPACGDGRLTVNATEIDFGWGTLDMYGFGGSVTLAASNGMFMAGTGTVDFGPAALNLETPYLGDRGSTPPPGVDAAIPSLTLTTTGAVDITNPTDAKAPEIVGTPGSSLTIDGHSVRVNDAELRATAGTLTLDSQTGIDISGNAVLETPSYARTFGDSADSVKVSAPGGRLSLIAQNGSIDAGAGTLLSIGGTEGTAGMLSLSADHGNFNLDGTIDASTPNGGGSLSISTGGAFNLSAFSNGFARDFTGSIDIRSGAGNLVLAAGDDLKAQNISLDADGGLVDIAGTIDVSGTNGGEVDLYGLTGVTLESTARVDAHANGYSRLDPRQASGGVVNIGTDGNGVITVKNGAIIDVAALQTMARLIPMTMNGIVYYTYVPGDVGGTVNFRLPVIQGQDGETVNMSYAGSIEGASAINLEGFQRWDLAQIADDANFVGVTINQDGQAVLDVGAVAGQGQLNFLADNGAGTVVQFVQDFNISADYGNLGGLASQSNFHARPGVELDYKGDIVLSSNWNLGAGTVNIQAAVKAGLMVPVVPGCKSDCQYYVVPGDEGEIFSKYTSLTYRVGGSVLGEPAILTMRAGGNLDINGSITDGFFQFGDQNDPNYLNVALGGGNRYYIPYLTAQCEGGNGFDCTGLADWQAGSLQGVYVDLALGKKLQSFLFNPVPYSAAANSAASPGDNGGNSLGSMQLFPLVTTAHGTEYVSSTSYRLVAGADLASADPMNTVPGSDSSVVVQGVNTYSYTPVSGTSQFLDQLDFQVGGQYLTADAWYMAFLTANPQADQNSNTFIDFSKAPLAVQMWIDNNDGSFLNMYPGQYSTISGNNGVDGITTKLNIANLFMLDFIEPNFSTILAQGAYTPPNSKVLKTPITATFMTLIRTGTGFIDVAAAQDINLQNLAAYEDLNGNPTPQNMGGYQLGGSPIYTAGHIVIPTTQTVVDELTGDSFTIDPSQYEDTANIFAQPLTSGYQYGDGGKNGDPSVQGVGYSGIVITNPVYAEGGGNISLTAGNDINSRRDVWQEALLAKYYDQTSSFGYDWIGTSDQAWRLGEVGTITNILINPQLFADGVGALGGGNVSVNAGHNIVDLTIADDTSVTTASVTSRSGLVPTLALWQFGGGNVTVDAGNDILGGRFDVAEGTADISAGGNIEGAPAIQIAWNGQWTTTPNTLRLRLTDATVSLSTYGTVELQGIGALGVQETTGQYTNDLDAHGFYSDIAGVSIVADGSVNVDNETAVTLQGVFDRSIVTGISTATNNTSSAVYPGSLEAASLTGTLDLITMPNSSSAASEIILYPSPVGQLDLYAAADIMGTTIDMDDGDPGLLPGIFSTFAVDPGTGLVLTGRTFAFPGVLPNTTQTVLQTYHNSHLTHLDDPTPVRIDAGGDILDMIVSVPKQARIWAGRDIVNMMFFGQNLLPSDITRVVAGRDITATETLVEPYLGNNSFGPAEPALEGNDFVVGGPGSFFLEAGRDAGPFLNSATTDGYENILGIQTQTGPISFGGGILSVGNSWNPWLAPVGANLYVEFGVGPGADYAALRNYYLDPANLANLPGYLFQQVASPSGNEVPDRSAPIYAPVLIQWMQQNAASVLKSDYHTTKVTYQQAYQAFVTLPELQQRVFLLDNVYYNELIQTSIPTGPSYQVYSRGYIAVNLLFPASLGYTQNNLSGGSNGANTLVQTGNLDLRLSAIETMWGGNIYILGPGGRVLAGSTVATAAQAARHTYIGGQLYAGVPITFSSNAIPNISLPYNTPYASAIQSIPAGYEGIITLRGGSIDTFTDEDFLLNQSRLFTEDGGNIAMWSSNADLNAGQGPKTSSDFPPVVIEIDEDLYSQIDSAGGVTGAGIAAFQPAPGIPAPDVFLIAPRGTVDAGAAGVRVAGNLFVAAFSVANASNFSVGGTAVGVPGSATVNVAAQTGASSSAAAAAQAAQSAAGGSNGNGTEESLITVEVLGPANGDSDEEMRKRKRPSS